MGRNLHRKVFHVEFTPRGEYPVSERGSYFSFGFNRSIEGVLSVDLIIVDIRERGSPRCCCKRVGWTQQGCLSLWRRQLQRHRKYRAGRSPRNEISPSRHRRRLDVGLDNYTLIKTVTKFLLTLVPMIVVIQTQTEQ